MEIIPCVYFLSLALPDPPWPQLVAGAALGLWAELPQQELPTHTDSKAGLASPHTLQTSYTFSFLIFDESLLSILFVLHFSADSLFHEAETAGNVRIIV